MSFTSTNKTQIQQDVVRVGLFTDGFTLPPKEGINVHVYEFARNLAEQPGFEVFMLMADRGLVDISVLEREPFTSVLIPERDYYNQARMQKLVQQLRIGILQADNVYYVISTLGPISLQTKLPLVTEFHDIEQTLAGFLDSRQPEDDQSWARQEAAARYSSSVRVMSKDDYEQLVSNYTSDLARRLFYMPVGVADNPKRAQLSTYTSSVLLIGNMRYAPNLEAAQLLLSTVAPQAPEQTFVFVGRGTDELVRYQKSSNVKLIGAVDDLTPFLSTAALGLAPILHGSGMKIKLLTYLSAGLPIIASSVAAKGYPSTPAIVIEDSPARFGQQIQNLLSDRQNWMSRSHAARKIYLKYFNIDVGIKQLADRYRQMKFNPHRSAFSLDAELPDVQRIRWLKGSQEQIRKPVERILEVRRK